MKTIAIIPARGGSKGIKRKNIKMLGCKPLIAYSIEAALESKLIDTVMVSTEDDEIAKVAQDFGLKVPFMRPMVLAQDHTPTIDVVVNVLEEYIKMGVVFDTVVVLEPTNPFRTAHEIDDCIKMFENKQSDSLITVKEVPAKFNPHWVFEENEEALLHKSINEPVIARRQILPKAYARDGSVYVVKASVVIETKSLYGETIAYRLNGNPNQINIDSRHDWIEAERILKSITPQMFKVG